MKYTLMKLLLVLFCANTCTSLLAMERPIEKEQDKQEVPALLALNTLINHLQNELTTAKQNYGLLEELYQQKNSDIENYEQELARKKARITELESQLEQANRTNTQLRQQLAQTNALNATSSAQNIGALAQSFFQTLLSKMTGIRRDRLIALGILIFPTLLSFIPRCSMPASVLSDQYAVAHIELIERYRGLINETGLEAMFPEVAKLLSK